MFSEKNEVTIYSNDRKIAGIYKIFGDLKSLH
jgi:hypothetical protein